MICEHCKIKKVYRPRWYTGKLNLCCECFLFWLIPAQLQLDRKSTSEEIKVKDD